MTSNSFQLGGTGFGNDKAPSTGSGEGDFTNDPASSGFFSENFKRHEDLKAMLDGNKDNLKLDAMKRIIGMVAKGKDASDLFPAVVKNVVSKNLEVKKLVYVYLTRYAEEQQDLALLSISTFQRALKDPNQLIRASALRVLSSIRVLMISPIMMLAIKEAVMDMSPYVRKTAAHAIPKLYSLDPESKEQLVEVIEKLLGDKTTLVAGSAIQAFEEVCPERIDLIHKNYRKLCNLLVDVEEWGQVVIVGMMTRYARTQFVSPNQEGAGEDSKNFYESDEDDDEKEETEDNKDDPKKKPYIMDSDHRLLLRQTKPLLNSRNASVVMSVAQLYHHCAPKSEVGVVAKALIRLLRGHKEVQYIVLSNIATMTVARRDMFEAYLKSFYIRSSDPTHIKLLKLEILTSLATETNISVILRELQTYVTSTDKEFAAATIQAIGRCASNITEITDTCLSGLVHLMSNRDESVVAESVVVIKKLLQMQTTEHKDIITHMAKMVDEIAVPMARASILWLIGEYSERVPKIAPDVLRKMAKSFVDEEDIVKLQILNLAAKMCITNSKQTRLLCQYVFNLAKYDQNYDIRDRSRFLRQLILPAEKGPLAKHAKKILLASKPAPVLQSKFEDRDQYQLGTLSHILNNKTTGYKDLPEWPQEAPDPSVRNVEIPVPEVTTKKSERKKAAKDKSFYSESETSSEDEDSDEESDDSDEDDEDEDSEEESEEESDDDEESEEESEDSDVPQKNSAPPKHSAPKKAPKVEKSESEEEEEGSSSEEESSSEESEDEKPPPKSKASKKKSAKETKAANQNNTDLLLDLDLFGSSNGVTSSGGTQGVILTPSMASAMSNLTISGASSNSSSNFVQPMNIPLKSYDLLNRMTGNGLGITFKFTRTISVFSPKMVSIELTLTNHGENPLSGIKVGKKTLQPGMEIQDFPEIASLGTGASTSVLMAINFNDTTQPAKFEICTLEQTFKVSITAPVGELLQPHTMGLQDFTQQQGKLKGMTENTGKVTLPKEKSDAKSVVTSVLTVANMLQVPSSESDTVYRFAAKTMSEGVLVLVSVSLNEESANIVVNCEKMVIGTMLLKDLKSLLATS